MTKQGKDRQLPVSVKTDSSRRTFLKGVAAAGVAGTAVAATAAGVPSWGGESMQDALGGFFQDQYQKMTDEEMADALSRIERNAKRKFGVDISCEDTPPIEGVVFGYAINISKCKGYRDCVHACVKENNLGRDSQMQYIRVLEFTKGTRKLESADHYYDHENVPAEDKYYMPVQCMQCDNSPCTAACPVGATWREPDGIVVIDYDWCIGCRFCMVSCPYWARHFNWTEPEIPAEELNPVTHYLGNRPRMKGVTEKCHFCIQRTRKGRLPACAEACPNGARVFGNLLDPNSEVRYVLENKAVFRLKEDLGTQPKVFYYSD